MSTILIMANHDYALYNFRKEVIIKILEEGHNVVISAPYGNKTKYFEKIGCRYINTPINRRGINPIKDIKLLLSYIRIIREIKPNVVLTYTSKCSIYGGMASSLINTPFIVNNSGLIILPERLKYLRPFISVLYKLGDTKSTCMMYQNSYEMEVLNKILNRKNRFKLIPGSGVNLVEYPYIEYPNEDNGIIFNYVARIMKGKGIEEYLKCAEIIKKRYPNTTFRIFGFFDDNHYKPIIDEYEKQGIVKYMGAHTDLKPFIEQAHAVIHPSHSEGMTNVCLEHSAMGRVSIATNIPGCKEIIEDEKTGYLFELKNVEQLVESVEKFIKLANNEKSNMGKLARRKMELEFDRNIIVDTYLGEINKIQSGKF